MATMIKAIDVKQVQALQDISIATFSETFAKDNKAEDLENYLRENYDLAKLTSELNNPNSFFYFIYHEEQLAGYLKLNSGDAQSEKRPANQIEIERIYLLQAFKGQGLGQRLMGFAIEQATKMHKDVIWLGVWEHNARALDFYQKNDFKITDKHSFFMGEDEQTDYIMERKLAELR